MVETVSAEHQRVSVIGFHRAFVFGSDVIVTLTLRSKISPELFVRISSYLAQTFTLP